MNKIPSYVYWIIIAVLVVLLGFKSCENKNGTDTSTTTTIKDVPVTIPEKKGEFIFPNKSEEMPPTKPDTVYIAGMPIYVPSPLDADLKKQLEAAKDEATQNKLLLDAVRKRIYSDDYSDEFVNINVQSSVFGKKDSTKIVYTLKPRQVIVQEKTVEKTTTLQSKLSLYVGGGADFKKDLSGITPKVEAGFMINNTTLLTGSYNTEGTIGVGLKIRIFNVNK